MGDTYNNYNMALALRATSTRLEKIRQEMIAKASDARREANARMAYGSRAHRLRDSIRKLNNLAAELSAEA